MDARYLRVPLIVAALLSLAANARTENFLVSASSPQLAQEVAQYAERYRRDLAIEWLGRELPPWQDKCPITVHASPGRPASGQTSFVFIQGQPRSWQMIVEGTRERVLDSVLPHEITHTILASHFGCPLPRWADEGACTTVEHASEKQKQDRMLIQFLTTNRGIAFNKMFAMRDYPPDILPLYSQGYSLARFLIAQGGKQKFIQYIGDGLRGNNWTRATKQHYGYTSLSDLQLTWVDWVRSGSSPNVPSRLDSLAADTQLAANTAAAPLPAATAVAAATRAPADAAQPASRGAAQQGSRGAEERGSRGAGGPGSGEATARGIAAVAASTTSSAGGWYARQRDAASAQRGGTAPASRAAAPERADPYEPVVRVPHAGTQATSRPPGLEQPKQVVIEWSRGGEEALRR